MKAMDADGKIVTNPEDIANVFGAFYESLYHSTKDKTRSNMCEARASLPGASAQEVGAL